MRLRALRLICFCALILLGSTELMAQQEAKYRQFLFNKLVFNPAYTGSDGIPTMRAIYRQQWYGLEGAPQTLTFQAHAPLKDKRIALGLQIINDEVGITGFTGIYTSYAFRFPVGRGKLSIGADAGALFHRTIFSEELISQLDDPTITTSDFKEWLPNISTGVYYYTHEYYWGFSAKDLVENSVRTVNTATVAVDHSHERRHFFAMGGYSYTASEKIELQPSALVTYVQDVPMTFQLNAGVEYAERVWLGGGYSTDDRAYASAILYATDKLFFGYNYEYSLSGVQSFVGASHEIMVGLDLQTNKNKRFSTPRSSVSKKRR